MKKMKKIFAVMLSLAMVLGMSLTAFAANPKATGTAADKGSITVNGVDDTKGTITVKAYPIVTADYDSATGNFTGYKNDWGIAEITAPTETELANIAAGKMANLVGDETTLREKALPASIELTKSGNSYTKDGLGVGMYLIIVEGAETNVYNPAVASINYVNENGGLVIDSSKPLTMATVADANTWVKKSGQPNLDKKVKNETLGETDYVQSNTGNIGDILDYKVEINPIPNYGGNFPVLNIKDTLSTGLTYQEGSLKVTIDGTALKGLDISNPNPDTPYDYTDKDYTYKIAGQEITVDFVVNGVYRLNDYATKKAVIEYKVKINENAKLNELGNNNDVVLTYSKNSAIENDNGTEEKKTYTYTFDIDGALTGTNKENIVDTLHIINKLGEETKTITTESGTKEVKLPLAGAGFGLFKDKDATIPYENKATGFNGKNIVSDEDGQLHMSGLAAGTYYLKEISAPEGYSVNSQIIPIVIAAKYEGPDSQLSEWSATIGGQLTKVFTLSYENGKVNKVEGENKIQADDSEFEGFNIYNTKLSSLPSTGGIGTTIFTVGGCAIMIIAAGLFFANRRKSVK